MAHPKSKKTKDAPENLQARDSREQLMRGAQKVFAQLGFDGTTVRDIAEAAGVNVSLVNYHFTGKDGLYAACIERFGKEKLALAQQVLTPVQSPEEFRVRLKLWVQQILDTHAEQQELCTIIHRESDLRFKNTKTEFQETFLKIFQTIVSFFESAQKSGIVRKDSDAALIAELFYMSVVQFARQDPLRYEITGRTIKDLKFRATVSDQVLETFLTGCLGGKGK